MSESEAEPLPFALSLADEARAGELYRKCWDALSGFEYYYNLRTGASMWQKPTLLGVNDADWVEPASSATDSEVVASDEAIRDDPSRVEKDPFAFLRSKLLSELPKTGANVAQSKQRFDDGVAFQQRCAQEKLALMKKHRHKIARTMQHWERKLESGCNYMLAQALICLLKQNVGAIREAAMRGHVERVRELLESDFSADAESFRSASLAFAHISKRQCESSLRKKESARKEVVAEAKVRYDEDKRTCHAQITILKKLETLEAADCRYDLERCRLLSSLQDALDMLRSSRQPRHLAESVNLHILSYCDRHWFEFEHSTGSRKRTRRGHKPKHRKGGVCGIQPTKLRDPPDKLPTELLVEWETFQVRLQNHCELLRDSEAQGRTDVETGVSRDLSGASRATLDVCVVEAEHLPLRDPRTDEAIDPLVRVCLRSSSRSTSTDSKDLQSDSHAFETDIRLADRNPKWDFSHQMIGVPSIHEHASVQVIDAKRREVAGETGVALRSLLDQKEHDEWLVLPPTLRQQLIEKAPRRHPARIHLRLKFVHTKSIVLARELQQLIKARDVLVQKKREFIQSRIAERMEQLQ